MRLQYLSDTVLEEYRGGYRALVLQTTEGGCTGRVVGLLSSLMA